MQWLSGMVTVPSVVHVVAGKVVGLGRSMITFQEGVAVFSHPMQGAVLDLLPCPRIEAVELLLFTGKF